MDQGLNVKHWRSTVSTRIRLSSIRKKIELLDKLDKIRGLIIIFGQNREEFPHFWYFLSCLHIICGGGDIDEL